MSRIGTGFAHSTEQLISTKLNPPSWTNLYGTRSDSSVATAAVSIIGADRDALISVAERKDGGERSASWSKTCLSPAMAFARRILR